MNIPVGTVPTTNSDDIVPTGHQTGRILSFPNFVQVCVLRYRDTENANDKAKQHKVLKLKNEGEETAVRKIVGYIH